MANELKRVGLVFKEEGAIDFRKTLQDINIEMNKNYNQFKLTQAQWDSSTKSTEKLRIEQEYLKNAYEIQVDKVSTLRMQLSDLENAENKNTTAIKKKQNELTNAELKLENYKKKIKDIDEALNNNGKKLEEWGTKVEKQGEKIEKAGKKLSAFSGATATAMVACTKSAIDFEDAFTGVEKTVDGTEEQMAELKQGIRDMAKEIPSSTTEIAAVAEAAGQLGIKTENILDFSKAMIDLGNSTNLTSDQAASQLAKFANIMGMSQKDFDRLGSSIVDLGNNFATTEADIVEMSMRLAGAGKQVGLSEGEVLGLATALSSVGIEAEMGGSAISKAMVKMQNAVELGGGKLNNVLKATGMSLRNLELLAANDSKGFKELANGLGMTSTELKNMITAGTNLEDFAKVSGMSVEQFKKAWKEDAVGALNEFIKGLGNAEDKGESAITMLSEMGITEVRLRDSLLRAANAGDLLSDAIKTGNEAWEDNTALTNEANKRYDTLKSKITTALNKLKDMAITIGNKLMPHIENIVDGLGKWVDGFSKLSDKEVETIVNIGLIIAAAGPLVTLFGKIYSTTGKVTKGIGTFTQALKVMKTGTDSSNESVNNLAGMLKGLTSPAGIATGAIGLVIGGLALVKASVDEELSGIRKLNEEIQNNTIARQNALDKINEQRDANLAEIDNVQKLKDELSNLVDENGKVKAGYEARTKFILGELNQALGTEYKLNNKNIEGYKKLKGEIDELILKKKAQIILEANEEKYKEAVTNKAKAYEDYLSTQKQINEMQEKYNKLQEEAATGLMGAGTLTIKQKEYREELEKLNTTLEEQEKQLQDYGTAISQYETNSELMLKGGEENLKKIEQSVATTQKNITDIANEKLQERIANQQEANEKTKELYDLEAKYNKDAKDNIYKTNVEEGEKNLKLLVDELVKQTTTVGELGEEETAAWKQLAQNSYDEYSKALAQMPPEMKTKIEQTTGIISNDESVGKAMKELAKDAEKGFNNNVDGKKWGLDLASLIAGGMSSATSVNKISAASGGLASIISSFLHFSVPDQGPLADMDKSMPDMIDLMAKGIDDNKLKLTKSVRNMSQDVADELQNINDTEVNQESKNTAKTYHSQNSKYNFTMNVYCQTLDENQLDTIFNYMNKRFGIEY